THRQLPEQRGGIQPRRVGAARLCRFRRAHLLAAGALALQPGAVVEVGEEVDARRTAQAGGASGGCEVARRGKIGGQEDGAQASVARDLSANSSEEVCETQLDTLQRSVDLGAQEEVIEE